MTKVTYLLIAILTIGLQVATCSSSEQERMNPVGPDVKASLVIYFKSGVTRDQIQSFMDEVLSRPDPEGRGFYLAPGVQSRLRVGPVQGHEGIALTFFANATPEQRERLLAEVKASPLVYKVLEGVAPDDVKKID